MSGLFQSVLRYAEDLTVFSGTCTEGRAARGFIQPLRFGDAEDFDVPAPPGRVSGARYLLVAAPDAILDGETGVTVACGGLLYEALRLSPFGVGGDMSHWEGILRLRGEVDGGA